MSRLPESFMAELRARTPMLELVRARVKLARSGRDWKGCCPFHGEKTPSFYVYPDHFHCFGCAKHGDAVAWVMEMQGLSFREAVDQLAAQAGLEVPRDVEQQERENRRERVLRVLADAAAEFKTRLAGPGGAQAREYLRERGILPETAERFGLGWSSNILPPGDPELLVAAGLMRPADAERPSAPYFIRRLMFPIRDRRGRVIGFSGRCLDDRQPKYLNGPETEVFVKGQVLYGVDLAEPAVRNGAALVPVEGQMDVLSASQAGQQGAVATLGTAITEAHLMELWRLSPAPIVCLDGDAAGQRAVAKFANVALPHLTPERTLRIATLPPDTDPDTLVQRHGAEALAAVLDRASPLVEALYGLLAEPGDDATPEGRAAFRARLEAAAGRIQHRALASEYRRALLARFFDRGGRGPCVRPQPVAAQEAVTGERARTLVAIVLRHPDVLDDVAEQFATLTLPAPWASLQSAILAAHVDGSDDLMAAMHRVGLGGFADAAVSDRPTPLPACAAANTPPAQAIEAWRAIFGLMAGSSLNKQIEDARRAFATDPSDAIHRRLVALCAARAATWHGAAS